MRSHLTSDQLARAFTAAALGLLGILQIARPGCFWGLSMYFAGARAAFSPDQPARLVHVLTARTKAEGDTDAYTRYAGVSPTAMAAFEVIAARALLFPDAASARACALA